MITMLSRRVVRLADEVHGVLEEARKLKINLSAVLTDGLTKTVRSVIFKGRFDGTILRL